MFFRVTRHELAAKHATKQATMHAFHPGKLARPRTPYGTIGRSLAHTYARTVRTHTHSQWESQTHKTINVLMHLKFLHPGRFDSIYIRYSLVVCCCHWPKGKPLRVPCTEQWLCRLGNPVDFYIVSGFIRGNCLFDLMLQLGLSKFIFVIIRCSWSNRFYHCILLIQCACCCLHSVLDDWDCMCMCNQTMRFSKWIQRLSYGEQTKWMNRTEDMCPTAPVITTTTMTTSSK